jgi:hypothetical protein
VGDIINYCHSRKKQLNIGCDANAHHILWGGTSINPRGESITKFLVSSNLNILNHGNKPEVIHLTLGTNKIGNLVNNWHASDEPSLSDHRYTCFHTGNITTNQVTFRNLNRTNWESYKDNVKVNLEIILRSICTIRDTDQSVDQLQQAIILSYYQNCPAKTTRSPRMAPWWNKNLSGLKAKTTMLFNIVKRTCQWDTYKETLEKPNDPLRRYCQEINDVPGSARLMKIMAKQATSRVSIIKLPDGQCTKTGKGTLKVIQSSLS